MRPERIESEQSNMHKMATLPSEYSAQVAELRELIDLLDDEIIQLISKRIQLSTRVMEAKPSSQVIDPTREQTIIHRYFEKLSGVSTLPKVKRLVLGIIGTSKSYPG
jgi:chorismate mutase